MSEKEKQPDNDPERTLMTLDQLSQTIEVMSSVVNRLRQHLSEQLREQAVRAQRGSSEGPSGSESAQTSEHRLNQNTQRSSNTSSQTPAGHKERVADSLTSNREPFVVEIRQQGASSTRKSDKTLH